MGFLVKSIRLGGEGTDDPVEIGGNGLFIHSS
jgi:hypothetical protein